MNFEWHPAALFRRTPEGKPSPLSKFALVILNQPLTQNAPLDILWENGECSLVLEHLENYADARPACVRIAADGGANRLLALDKQTSKEGKPGQYVSTPAVGRYTYTTILINLRTISTLSSAISTH